MKENVVLVTGAASGIGRAVAVAFAQKGADLVLADLDPEGLEKTKELCREFDGERLALKIDVSEADEVKAMIDETMDRFGRLDVACNNAGIEGSLAATADYTLEEWNRVIGVNLTGQWLCMKYEIPVMLQNEKGGAIVNISSILGRVGYAEAPAYSAAKHGLLGLTKTAALEYASKGVRVNAVCPAFIETPMLDRAGITSEPETRKVVEAMHPIGRLGKSREIADAVVWLASPEASFITGESLMVDGGYIAR